MKCIELTKGQIAIVDDEDFERLAQYRWCVSGEGYAVRRRGSKLIAMHHEILPPQPGMLVDHRNGNTVDNRRDNLRLATHSQNGMNRRCKITSKTGIKGVWWVHRQQRYVSQITVNRKIIYVGSFKTKEEAAAAYAEAAKLHHGDFHRLN